MGSDLKGGIPETLQLSPGCSINQAGFDIAE
jgi:hypothetical protein